MRTLNRTYSVRQHPQCPQDPLLTKSITPGQSALRTEQLSDAADAGPPPVPRHRVQTRGARRARPNAPLVCTRLPLRGPRPPRMERCHLSCRLSCRLSPRRSEGLDGARVSVQRVSGQATRQATRRGAHSGRPHRQEERPGPGAAVLLLFFGDLSPPKGRAAVRLPFSRPKARTTTDTTPSLFLRGKRCVTCVTGGPKRHLTCRYGGDANARVCVIPRHPRHPGDGGLRHQ